MIQNDYKYLGWFAVLILVLGLSFVVIKWPQSKNLSFSQHVAKKKTSITYYSLLFTLVIPLLLLFFTQWFIPNYELSVWFGLFIILSCLSQLVCTFIPELGGWKTKWHRILAGFSAISLIPALLMIFASNNISTAAKFLTIVSLLVMTVIISVIISAKGKHSHFLVLQTVYFAVFFIPIIFISYVQ